MSKLFVELSQKEESTLSGGFLDFGSKKKEIKQKFERVKARTGEILASEDSFIEGSSTGNNYIGSDPRV